MNCKVEVLYRETNGTVLRCKDCGLTQLAYGTTHCILTWKSFRILLQNINTKAERINHKSSKQKCHSIPIPNNDCRLFLSNNELLELKNIMDQGYWQGTVLDLLKA